ncbi:hypothetical protein [Acinetobacter baumannii]|uniref:hypothetical protein n=1 Tax=Acinetobacter baumannii TaxID=470 RepID=UPI00385C67D3
MATNWNAVLANINNASDILAILRKVLGLLDGKVDLTRIDEIINDLSTMKISVDSALSNVNSALLDFDTEAQEAIQQVIAAGLMEGFATEAELLATRPTEPKKYAKAEDTDVIWFWNKPEGSPDGNYWTSTGLSEYERAKRYAEEVAKDKASEAVSEFLKKAKSNTLVRLDDVDGNVFALIDEFAELFLAGSDISVQEMGRIATRFANIVNTRKSQHIWEVYDSEGNLGTYLDHENELFLTGLNVSVQEALRTINIKTKHLNTPTSQLSAADLPTSEVMNSINWLKNLGIQICDLPKTLFPQQFHVGKSFLNTVGAPTKDPADYIKIDVWNDRGDNSNWKVDSGVVHPNLIDFGEGKELNGFRYWMGLNAYTSTSENYELPYIFGSNDLNNWELMTNIPCPFDVDPKTNADDPTVESTSGHLSDSFFTYDTSTGELFFCWRRNLYFENGRDRAKAKCSLWARSTKDGVNWTDKFEIYPEYTNITKHIIASPSILFNPRDNLYYLYHISDSVGGIIRVQTSSSLHNPKWSEMVAVEGLESIAPYHLEAKYVGDQVVLLIHSEVTDQLYFAASDDFINFKVSKKILETDTDTYKGSFLPIFNDQNQVAFHIFYTSDQKALFPWRLYHTQTNFNLLGAE